LSYVSTRGGEKKKRKEKGGTRQRLGDRGKKGGGGVVVKEKQPKKSEHRTSCKGKRKERGEGIRAGNPRRGKESVDECVGDKHRMQKKGKGGKRTELPASQRKKKRAHNIGKGLIILHGREKGKFDLCPGP